MNLPPILKPLKPKFAMLFGSKARDDFDPASDVENGEEIASGNFSSEKELNKSSKNSKLCGGGLKQVAEFFYSPRSGGGDYGGR